MIKTELYDSATRHRLSIDSNGSAHVVLHGYPPTDETYHVYPFRQYLTNDGTASGSNDMIVSSADEFYVSAHADVDIFIKRMSFRLGDTGTVDLSRFGALTALTTGCALTHYTTELGEITLADALKTNLSLIRLGQDTAAVGTGGDAFLLDVVAGGTEDTYLPVLDFNNTFGFRHGLRLRKGSLDRLIFKVNDNLTGLITFNCIATGIQLL